MAVTDEVSEEYAEELRRNVENMNEKTRKVTEAMMGPNPPTNPIVVMDCGMWWYQKGRGGNDPVYQWCLNWCLQTGTDHLAPVSSFSDAKEYLEDLGFNV